MADESEAAKQASGDDSAVQPGDAWGDPINEDRQKVLRELFERQKEWAAQPEATRGDSVFKGMRLTGADVSWLAKASEPVKLGNVPNLHLEKVYLSEAQLEGANLSEAHLEGAYLREAQLEGANLNRAQLEGANLREAQLARANLHRAQLAGASLSDAQVAGASLTSVTFDKATHLNDTVLTGASLDQVTYDGVNLTVVDWSLVLVLGDELAARQRKDKDGKRKSRAQRINDFTAAVRANRVLAVTLRSQGMNEDADRYAYRAQLLQRTLLRLRRRWGAAFGSWLLDVVSGYGYKPVRSIITYVTTIAIFAVLYWCVTNDISLTHGLFTQVLLWLHMTPPIASHQPLQPYEAVVVSMTSFHGRGFFQPIQSPGDKVAILAAIEAAVGLLIEIVFIATFTQRFFAR